MMSSPLASLVICLAYVYVVQVALPRFMEKREPLELRLLMIVYNFVMVALSGYIFIEVGRIASYGIVLYCITSFAHLYLIYLAPFQNLAKVLRCS